MSTATVNGRTVREGDDWTTNDGTAATVWDVTTFTDDDGRRTFADVSWETADGRSGTTTVATDS